MRPLPLSIAVLLSAAAWATSASADPAVAGARSQACATALKGGPRVSSLTRGQVESRIIRAGYTSVKGLFRTSDGVWLGTAMRNEVIVTLAMGADGRLLEGGDWPAQTADATCGELRPPSR